MNKAKIVALTQPVIDEAHSAEEFIAYAARVSNPANQALSKDPYKLVRYLMEHSHWSPFEMVNVVIQMDTTRDIARQVLRHRSMHFQEFSQRYADITELSDEMSARETRLQDHKNRQNSLVNTDLKLETWWKESQEALADHAMSVYAEAVLKGVAKEQARVVLPEGLTPSRLYANATVRDWYHYCKIRTDPSTQKEHRELAESCYIVLRDQFPSIFNWI